MGDVEQLLSQTEWMRALARRLVGPDADDVVQDAWIATLRNPPDPGRPPRPWLAEVVRNVSRMRWRAATRRAARDERETRDAAPAERPDEALAVVEAHHRLCEAIRRLTPESQQLIVLHYFEQLPLVDIAHRLGAPAGTIRWRHKQALDQLRSHLDAAHDNERRRWIAALSPLVTSPTTSTTAILGGAIVKKLIAVVVILLVALLAWRSQPITVGPNARLGGAFPRVAASPAPREAHGESTAAPARAAIAGRVRDHERGAPIAGALVCAAREDDGDPSCADADPDGRYQLRGLSPGRYSISATAAGHTPGAWRGAAPELATAIVLGAAQHADGIDIALMRGGAELHGRVRDVNGGPIAGATVWLTSGTDDQRLAIGYAVVRDDGRFSAWVGRGVVSGRGRADGYADGVAIARAPGGTLDVLLTPESQIIGTVVELETGLPIAGAEVVAGASAPILIDRDLGSPVHTPRPTVSDGAGRFVLTGLTPDRYRPRAKREGLVGAAPRSVVLGLGETTEVVIEVRRLATVTARVSGPPCQTLAGSLAPARGDAVDAVAPSVTAGDGATLRFTGVAPGRYRVTVGCDGWRDDRNPALDVADRDVEVAWRVDPPAPSVAVRGEVRDAAGARLAGVPVVLRDAEHDALREATSLADGRFELGSVRSGRFTIEARPRGARPAATAGLEVTGAELPPISLIVPGSTRITGRVRDDAGAAPAGLIVHLVPTEGLERRAAPTGDDGAFEIAGVVPGDYVIFASHSRMAWEPPRTRKLAVGSSPVEVELEVTRATGTITGTLLDEHGRPISDGYVTAASARGGDPAGALHAADRRQVLTDQDGGFVLDRLAEGPYVVLGMRRGGGTVRVDRVNVGTRVTLAIAATGSIAGQVVTADGAAVERFIVRAHDPIRDFYVREAFASRDGRFTIDAVPSGRVTVVVTATDGDGEGELTVPPGGVASPRIVLAPRPRVIGRVISAEPMRPLEHVAVSIVRGDGDSPGANGDQPQLTGADGRFEVVGAPLGACRIGVSPRDRRWGHRELSRVIESREVIDLGDIVLDPADHSR